MDLPDVAWIKGAIFDQDGLLFDTEVLFERAWREVGAEFGVKVPDALPYACCGCGRKELPDVIRRFLPDIDVDAYIERALNMAFSAQAESVPTLKPGVRKMLAKCRENGIRTAVASSSLRSLVEHNLRSSGLLGMFDAIVTGEDVVHGKPAPDIFLLAASRIDVPPPRCLVFEDAFTGIRAAHVAGCNPVLIPDRIQPTPEILGICSCFKSLDAAADSIFAERCARS